MKLSLWIFAAFAAVFLLMVATIPRGKPYTQHARSDFLAEHPTYTIERVILDENKETAVSYCIFYFDPSDTQFHEEFRQYLLEGTKWRIAQKIQKR